MGYSLYVVSQKEDLARKLHQYLSESLELSWLTRSRIASSFDDSDSCLSYNSYGKNRHQVGFDYSCMGELESAFIYDLIKWMAKALGLTTYVHDTSGYTKIEGKDAESSLDRAYAMAHVDPEYVGELRDFWGLTEETIAEAKRRLQQIKDGWKIYKDKD